MTVEEKIETLRKLPFVKQVAEHENGHLTVIAVEPTLQDYARIDDIVGDTDVEVCSVVEAETEEFPRFIGEADHHEWRSRNRSIRMRGEATMIQARAKLEFKPQVNVWLGDHLGILFGSVDDKMRYSEYR